MDRSKGKRKRYGIFFKKYLHMNLTETYFKDRKDAGRKLADKLLKYKDTNALILGIPRGGAEIAYHIAEALNAELSVIIAKKLAHPSQPEYGIGALCEEGTLYIREEYKVHEKALSSFVLDLQEEVKKRVILYRKGLPLPDMKGRTVILADDGIATGVTLVAALHLCRKHGAGRVVIASPVSGLSFAREVYDCDELVILERPEVFFGVGQVYMNFEQLEDDQVISFLEKHKHVVPVLGNQKRQKKEHKLETAADLEPLLERIGDSKLVLLGEASHGTHEYYTWRSAISRRLITEKGFNFIAVEGDWPDCYKVNRYIKGYSDQEKKPQEVLRSFNRWPTWMWANWEVAALVEWMKDHNEGRPADKRAGFYGLDVYSLWESMEALISYLKKNDPPSARIAERAMRCFERYEKDERHYALHALSSSCKEEVINLLKEVRLHAPSYNHDPEASLNSIQNAAIAVEAEKYYRSMTSFDDKSWNIRDKHMMETLERLMEFHGPNTKAIVWEHNTHVGDARYTDMKGAGMLNVGQLVRERYSKNEAVLVGFGSYKGKVIAGRGWGEPMMEMNVPEGKPGSLEEVLHLQSEENRLIIFGETEEAPRIIPHRAIGVVYNPNNEHGNYVPTELEKRYDAFIYIDTTSALHPLHVEVDAGQMPETYPFTT
jgi:erythromycin esterase